RDADRSACRAGTFARHRADVAARGARSLPLGAQAWIFRRGCLSERVERSGVLPALSWEGGFEIRLATCCSLVVVLASGCTRSTPQLDAGAPVIAPLFDYAEAT